ncbi:glycosyltransferase [Gordonia sp. HS-NH1]|uniref:glycosyltransferase n=1 Tax=Gordonia sp. HS-NH1 TaxID=1435068 RepID=UPI000A3F666C
MFQTDGEGIVIAVTVTYGDRAGLCNETVRAALDARAARVVVVLNGSSPTASAAIHERWSRNPAVDIVLSETNLGSAGGYAMGIEAAGYLATDADRLWLLDDDNLPRPDCLQLLLEAATAIEQRTGQVCVVFANRTANPLHSRLSRGMAVDDAYPAPGSYIYFDVLSRLEACIQRGLGHLPTPEAFTESPSMRQIPYGPYGGMLINARLATEYGTPSLAHFVYEDDTEYTFRFNRNGVPLVWVESAKVDERDAKWTQQASGAGLVGMLTSDQSDRLYLSVRNRVFFDIARCTALSDYVRLIVNGALYTFAVLLLSLRHGHWRSAVTYARAVLAVATMPRHTVITRMFSRRSQ